MLNLNFNWVTEAISNLAQWWPIVKSNFQSIQTNHNNHVDGTGDRHTAPMIDYSGSVNAGDVKSAIDNLKQDITNLNFTGSEHDALVTGALVDTENEDFGPGGNATYLNGRLSKWEQKFSAQLSDTAQDISDLNTNKAGKDEVNALATNKVDKDGSGQINWSNIAQDVREQILGTTPPAVVGVNAVLETNITNGAVTPKKLSFIEVVNPLNWFNTATTQNKRVSGYVNGSSKVVITGFVDSGSDTQSAEIPVKSGDTVRIGYIENGVVVYPQVDIVFLDSNKAITLDANGNNGYLGTSAGSYAINGVNIAYIKFNSSTYYAVTKKSMVLINNTFPEMFSSYFAPYYMLPFSMIGNIDLNHLASDISQMIQKKYNNLFVGVWSQGGLDANGVDSGTTITNSRTQKIDVSARTNDYISYFHDDTIAPVFYIYEFDVNNSLLPRTTRSLGNSKSGSIKLHVDSKTIRFLTYMNPSTQLISPSHFMIVYGDVVPKEYVPNHYEIKPEYIENLDDEIKSNVISNPFVKTIAHAGGSNLGPENTIPAIIASKKIGYQYAEFDIQMTSDGVPVVIHDSTVNKSGRNDDETVATGNVSSFTLANIKLLDFGVWKGQKYKGTRISTLDEFLKACKRLGLKVFPEWKISTWNSSTGNYDPVLSAQYAEIFYNAVVSNDMLEYCIFLGDTGVVNAVRTLHEASSNGKTAFAYYPSAASINAESIMQYVNWRTDKSEIILDLDYTGITSEIASLCKTHKLPLYAWTVNDTSALGTLVDLGVTGIASDWLDIPKELFNSVG